MHLIAIKELLRLARKVLITRSINDSLISSPSITSLNGREGRILRREAMKETR